MQYQEFVILFIKINNIYFYIMIQKGGKSIASGSYGCVFRPSLKCNDKNKRSTNNLSYNKKL